MEISVTYIRLDRDYLLAVVRDVTERTWVERALIESHVLLNAVARLENETASGVEFGAVGYTHAGGVDRPLLAWKGTGNNPAMVVIPHMSWRGTFGGGTYMSGNVTTHPIVWPGFQRTAWHKDQPNQQATKVWTGSLLEGQRDASGQMYMRDRYYDPVTGQFTQTDPIGLAGGMNAYGFAAGDPVSYSDPYGLKVCASTRRLRQAITDALIASQIVWDKIVGASRKIHDRGARTRRTIGDRSGYAAAAGTVSRRQGE